MSEITPEIAQSKAETIATFCDESLDLASASLSPEYYYNSLPFCLIDAIFSIGIRYTGVRKTVIHYCDHFGLDRLASPLTHSARKDDHRISDFLDNIGPYAASDYGAFDVYQSKCRTSTKGGMLKAQAVYEAAVILHNHHIETIHDINAMTDMTGLEADFCAIRGQNSGISFSYLLMLSGDDSHMKIDRWLMRFCEKATASKNYTTDDAENDLMTACRLLQKKYHSLTPRLLDHTIWNYMSRKH